MRKLFLILLLLTACAHKPQPQANTKNICFLLYDLKKDKLIKVEGEEHCQTRITPCSTFKVPLSLMAFDSKVLKTTTEVMEDQTPLTWMKNSVVWYSQKLTPKLGHGLVNLKSFYLRSKYLVMSNWSL